MILTETNEEIYQLVKHLDSKILLLRSKYPNSKFLLETIRFYQNIVVPWMEEYQMKGEEPDRQYDESVKNDVLDVINIINSILKK